MNLFKFLSIAGTKFYKYLELVRPHGLDITFDGIIKRAQSPFVLKISLPSPYEVTQAQVSCAFLRGDPWF